MGEITTLPSPISGSGYRPHSATSTVERLLLSRWTFYGVLPGASFSLPVRVCRKVVAVLVHLTPWRQFSRQLDLSWVRLCRPVSGASLCCAWLSFHRELCFIAFCLLRLVAARLSFVRGRLFLLGSSVSMFSLPLFPQSAQSPRCLYYDPPLTLRGRAYGGHSSGCFICQFTVRF